MVLCWRGDSVFKCIGNCAECGRCFKHITNERKFQGLSDGIKRNFEKNPITSNRDCYGLALDIGTTTIAAYLYKLPECERVGEICIPNSQIRYGGDVISRIEHSNAGGLRQLKDAVWNQIAAIEKHWGQEIDTYVITANTTMLHFLAGLDPRGIAVAPFTPQSLFGEWRENVYFPRCISSYIGADITTGILASNMCNEKTSFLVDIGTNGEMALWNGEKLTCCSTAAGPAFEGANITNGCPAVSGAINKVYVENGEAHCTTIDGADPIGVCGTGLIDAVACMLELGVIDDAGYMDEDFEIGNSGVHITAQDIRQVQLAKSAVRAGIDTLLEQQNVTYGDIENFYIAGGFGSYIDKVSAAKIGLIPTGVLDKVVVVGNAAGAGASMILQSRECLEEAERIALCAEAIELSANPAFMEKYINNIMF